MILFVSADGTPLPRQRRRIKSWLERVANHHGAQIESLSFAFGSSSWMAELNQRYLAHEGDTDILTFDYQEGVQTRPLALNKPAKVVNGECCISPGMIREQAAFWKTTFEDEMHRVLVHGLLHLLGYDDRSATQKKQMRTLEEEALAMRSAE
ncbi:MAG: rRNA maturation RNase YbeY [Cytophagia bacterium]|nr:rRNA maturation RNase YbeY [Cytophagia bacterium]